MDLYESDDDMDKDIEMFDSIEVKEAHNNDDYIREYETNI
jgi:hypothetical protein